MKVGNDVMLFLLCCSDAGALPFQRHFWQRMLCLGPYRMFVKDWLCIQRLVPLLSLLKPKKTVAIFFTSLPTFPCKHFWLKTYLYASMHIHEWKPDLKEKKITQIWLMKNSSVKFVSIKILVLKCTCHTYCCQELLHK